MLYLVHSISSLLPKAESSFLTNRVSSYRFGNYKPWVSKKSRRKNGAMDEDDDFEVDMDKARAALRKLDEQFKSLSEKQTTPPKIRAAPEDFSRISFQETQESVNLLSGSSLTYLASGLLFFTLLYNVVFIMVIKPSIDGNYREVPVLAAKVNQGTQGESSIQERMATPEMPVGM